MVGWMEAALAADVALAGLVAPDVHAAGNVLLVVLLTISHPKATSDALIGAIGILAIAALSLVFTLAYPAPAGDVVKGLYYLLRPMVYIIVGATFLQSIGNIGRFGYALTLGALLSAAFYTFKYTIDPNVAISSRFYIREYIGKGSVAWGVAAVFLILCMRFVRLNIGSVVLCSLALALILYAIVISTSRSYLAQIAILLLATAVPFPSKITRVAIVGSLTIVWLLCSTPLLRQLGLDVDYSVLQPIPLIGEIAPVDQNTFEGINLGWRGYEVVVAFRSIFDQGWVATMFGVGAGQTVRLGFWFSSGSVLVDDLPVFHNIFTFLMVRSGFMGIILFFVISLGVASRFIVRYASNDREIELARKFAFGLLVFHGYYSSVASGIYNVEEQGAIIGLCLGAFLVSSSGAPGAARVFGRSR